MPVVDIIVPAYNAARFLPAALESVLSQTFSDWRIVLVDDGSTDETAVIAKSFAEQLGSKMLVIQQTNKGLPAARNVAIRHSSAEFLALLDADDIWLPSRLAASIELLRARPEVGLVYGGVSLIDQNAALISTPWLQGKNAEGWIASGIYTRALDLPCPTITFRRACVEEVGDFDESMRASEDRDLWLRISLRYQVARIDRVIALYRISSGSMSSDSERMASAQIRFIEKHYGSAGCEASSRRVALSSVYRQVAETMSARGYFWSAVKNILHALIMRPAGAKNWRTAGSILKGVLHRKRAEVQAG